MICLAPTANAGRFAAELRAIRERRACFVQADATETAQAIGINAVVKLAAWRDFAWLSEFGVQWNSRRAMPPHPAEYGLRAGWVPS